MAFLDDVSVQWNLSPRIIRVAAPTVEVALQDLHDTLVELEARPENLVYSRIIESSGKQSLGGGTYVGITSELKDARLAFNARKDSVTTGSITTTDVTGHILTDVSATFVTDGVEPGAWIVNITDRSVCSVVVVQDENNLVTDYPGDGITNQFTSGDDYKVWNVIQCNVAGGNLVAVDTGSVNIDPILPTAGTQVVKTSAASATLQELIDIQYGAYMGGVTYNVNSIFEGTTYPVGTPRAPVNNTTDALQIIRTKGFTKLFWRDELLVDSGLDYREVAFIGEGLTISSAIVTSEANVYQCMFNECSISGTLDGGCHLNDCEIEKLDYIDGQIDRCELEPARTSDPTNWTVRLSGTRASYFVGCYAGARSHAGEARVPQPIIDCGGSGSSITMVDYSGDLRLQNKTGADHVHIQLDGGCLYISPTVTSGTIRVSGVGQVFNESSATWPELIVEKSCLTNPNLVAAAVWETELTGSVSGTVGYMFNSIESTLSVIRDATVAATATIVGMGSTSSTITTSLTQADGFFDGMFVQVIGSTGSATRYIESYSQSNGTIDVSSDPLPFTPSTDDTVIVLAQHTFNTRAGFG